MIELDALVAARPRCTCDTTGPDLCPAGCGAQRDRMATAELERRTRDGPRNQALDRRQSALTRKE